MNARLLDRGRGSGAALRRTLATVALVATVVGCGSDDHPVIVLDNRTAVEITVVFINALGQESGLVNAISPGTTYPIEVFPTNQCTPGFMLARNRATGADVARSPSPVCRPSRWIIEAPPAASPF